MRAGDNHVIYLLVLWIYPAMQRGYECWQWRMYPEVYYLLECLKIVYII